MHPRLQARVLKLPAPQAVRVPRELRMAEKLAAGIVVGFLLMVALAVML